MDRRSFIAAGAVAAVAAAAMPKKANATGIPCGATGQPPCIDPVLSIDLSGKVYAEARTLMGADVFDVSPEALRDTERFLKPILSSAVSLIFNATQQQ